MKRGPEGALAFTSEGTSGPLTIWLGSIHCHSTRSDGGGDPEAILAAAGREGLDFVAITDHVPIRGGGLPAERAPRPPLSHDGVVRVRGLEYSGTGGHLLVLGADPEDVPPPRAIPGWPEVGACVRELSERPDVVTCIAHPDDRGNPFLNLLSYRWQNWDQASAVTALEVWNLGTDWSRMIRSYRDLLRALWAGLYRAVPPPDPRTLARWDKLAMCRRVVGIAGTDAHAYPIRWKGLRLTVLPYRPAFSSLQTGVWVDPGAAKGTPADRARSIVEAIRNGRAFMVNRAWGHPLGFVFQARVIPDRPGMNGRSPKGAFPRYISGDMVPAGTPVRFEVASPRPAWLRLVCNGKVVANSFGRDLLFEPMLEEAPPGLGSREAWRVEVWAPHSGLTRASSRVYLWILSNFIYRGEEVSPQPRRK